MYAALVLLAVIAAAAASDDDGQWHPELDGSSAGSGLIRWGNEDGSWKPDLDGSWQGRGDLVWVNRKKRAANPNSLATPEDEPGVANAKNAQLRQQYSEAFRNIYGGVPTDLPADTPEVAAGKQAHAIAHENQKLATSGRSAAQHVTRIVTPVTQVVSRVAHVAPVVSSVTHIAAPFALTRTYSYTPVHVASPVVHIASPVVHSISPYHTVYSPVVQTLFYKKK